LSYEGGRFESVSARARPDRPRSMTKIDRATTGPRAGSYICPPRLGTDVRFVYLWLIFNDNGL